MRLTMIALAALAAASAAPAAACGVYNCADLAVADDSYPLGQPVLPPYLHALVDARHGTGLSLAAFYNDPSLALALAQPYAPAGYGYAPPPVDYGYGEPRPFYGPHVIVSPYGRGRPYAHRYGHRVY